MSLEMVKMIDIELHSSAERRTNQQAIVNVLVQALFCRKLLATMAAVPGQTSLLFLDEC